MERHQMKEKPNYYAVIPANVRYDKELKDKAKLLYGEIVALSNKDGYCYASNKYFANLYDVSEQTIINMINNLEKKKYIERTIIYEKGTKKILGRYLKIFDQGTQNILGRGTQKILLDNNTSINNININKKENIKRKSFTKPTIEEIQQYCTERNNGINAEAFYDFYESKNWYVGKNKMVDWQASVRTWENRDKTKKYKSSYEKRQEMYRRVEAEYDDKGN